MTFTEKLTNYIKSTLKNWQNEDGEIDVDNGNIDSLFEDIKGDIEMAVNQYTLHDTRLKDITKVIETSQPIQLDMQDTGERIYPNYSQISDYSEYYVTGMFSCGTVIIIKIKSEI